MTKRRKNIKKKVNRLHLIIFKIIKRGFRRVPAIFWGSFALIGALTIGVILGIELQQKPALNQTPYQKEMSKNEKYLKLILSYEDLNKLYSDQAANLDITFNRDMVENHPDQVNSAILSIDHYRDMILVEMGRIEQLRKEAGLPPENFSQNPKIQ